MCGYSYRIDVQIELADLRPDDRKLLEETFRRLVARGKIAASGEREVRFRIDTDGRIRWYEASTIRAPASELELVDGQASSPTCRCRPVSA